MSEDRALALLGLLSGEDGQSLPRVAKRLEISVSELQRLLVALGDDPRFDGLDLVEQRRDGERTLLWLTARGRAFLGHAMSEGLRTVETLHLDARAKRARRDDVIEETPLAMLYNGEPFAVMMATPCDLEDFALGFALSEDIVAAAEEFRLVDIVRNTQGVALHAAIPQTRFDALGDRRRNLEGRSGCGLCGVESLQAAMRPIRRIDSAPSLTTDRIRAGLDLLAQQQPLNARSGGVHAAGFVHADGILVREDVGRHNAFDKVIGAMARATPTLDAAQGFLAITSRASYEIVHKAASAGIGVVVAISAPTDLAIRLADEAGITLIAFARGATMNVYSRADRIV